MANEIFVNTSGFYVLLVTQDDGHPAAKRLVADSSSAKSAVAAIHRSELMPHAVRIRFDDHRPDLGRWIVNAVS